jgi:hypothetical protein
MPAATGQVQSYCRVASSTTERGAATGSTSTSDHEIALAPPITRACRAPMA